METTQYPSEQTQFNSTAHQNIESETSPPEVKVYRFIILCLIIFIVLLLVSVGYLFSTNFQLTDLLVHTTDELKVRDSIEISPTVFSEVGSISPIVTLVASPTAQLKDIKPPSGWIAHYFQSPSLTIYTPKDWDSSSEYYQNTSSTLLKFWKKSSPSIVPIQIDIKPNWDNTGNAQYLNKNYEVAGRIDAARVDPPKKQDKILERYQTNVYFEHEGNVFVFQCVHNWTPDYVQTCDSMLETMKFE